MRECGSCGMCCHLLKIRTLQKNSGQWCEHWEKDKGCKLENVKPEECRRFACLWLSELIPDELSPRKTGIVAWATKEQQIVLSRNKNSDLEAFKPAIMQWVKNGLNVGIVRPI